MNSSQSIRLQITLWKLCCFFHVILSWTVQAWAPTRQQTQEARIREVLLSSNQPRPFGHERIRTSGSSYHASSSTTALWASSSSSSQSTRSTSQESNTVANNHRIESLCEQVQDLTAKSQFTKAFALLTHVMQIMEDEFASSDDNDTSQYDPLRHQALSRQIDRTCRSLTQTIFAPSSHQQQRPKHKSQNDWSTLLIGLQTMELQWHSTALTAPYHTLPRATVQQALQALTRYNERQQHPPRTGVNDNDKTPSQLAFRLLQRLLSGVGVRSPSSAKTTNTTVTMVPNTQYHHHVYEKDINMVLNTFSNAGHMHVCHRIVALQQRSPQTPPLSAAAYSILFKGHGLRREYRSLQMVLQHAMEHLSTHQMDTIFCNSLVNALIQCGAVGDAFAVFDAMRTSKTTQPTLGSSSTAAVEESSVDSQTRQPLFRPLATPEQAEACPLTEFADSLPRPNQRTYNIVLKGLAHTQNIDAAMELFENEMKVRHKWDAISINSLVQVALSTENYDLAHELLENYTAAIPQKDNQRRQKHHPNTEAYTQLLDSYAKAGRLSDALLVFGLMRLRQIPPNEFTYTCLIAGLARNGKVADAHKMLEVMKTTTAPTIVTYNALISALTSTPPLEESSSATTSTSSISMNPSPSHQNSTHDSSAITTISYEAVEEALKVLRSMIRNKVKPNAITVCTLVDALGRCSPQPRVQEAVLLVDRLEAQKLIPSAEPRIISALIHTAGMGQNITAAVQAFRRFSDHQQPLDVVAVNAFLDACCKCGRGNIALDTFQHYFGSDKKTASASSAPSNGLNTSPDQSALEPDVITYSTLITHLLKSGKHAATEKARTLYESMKKKHRICPDTGLIDSILKSMLQMARVSRLPKEDVVFVATVLRDAQRLEWSEGQLERRQRAVRAVLADRFQELRSSSDVSSLLRDIILQPNQDDDDLFRRKGWNTIDSSMRILWGGQGNSFEEDKSKGGDNVDAFLKSKGWNNVDSGFRIF